MLEITGKEINSLNDSDLRSLVGLLCEAELRSKNISTAAVTFGGHQDAKDGGLDVWVLVSEILPINGFIPKANTGFQVKKPDMPRSEIIKEMRPKDELRKVICELANTGGAYIIISSTGSTTYSALSSRRKAMREALSAIENANQLTTDFYDRERIAAWVRSHPSLILWVRDKIGRPIQGWRPFENWANPSGEITEEYLLDEEIRLCKEGGDSPQVMAPLEGINCLRKTLSQARSSVRLVGLSGVGKTRLLQALFDDRIGENPLNPSQVYYADMGGNPNPDPSSVAEYLIAGQSPAILVVDNCPPELHRQLTSLCIAPRSLIRLLTVEYDIREDQPEETDVFRLEPASQTLIERLLLRHRIASLSPTDARTIAKFSDGNSRIALALANTVSQGGTLAHLKDEELFNRLFEQRYTSQSALLKSAEICSLVYSFDGENMNGDSELSQLADLANMSSSALFSDLAELKRRGLVQHRNIWRAVLPHAIANRLAQRALENFPLTKVLNVFEDGPERLLESFSRRLSYLVGNPKAIKIAERWLSSSGLLKDLRTLNDHTVIILANIAPLVPALVVSVIRATMRRMGPALFCRSNPRLLRLAQLLRSIAYDPDLFQSTAEMLCCFSLTHHPNGYDIQSRNILRSLFYSHYSGTHASSAQRLDLMKGLVNSENEDKQGLGLELLGGALQRGNFTPDHPFDFGGHSRDYGYWPTTQEEVYQWFNVFLSFLMPLALSDQPIAFKAKKLFADNFRGLWVIAGVHDLLEGAVNGIHRKGAWKEGWLAISNTIRFDASKMEPPLVARLKYLKNLIAPTTLLEKARACLHSGFEPLPNFDGSDCEQQQNRSERNEQDKIVAKQIGKEVAEHPDVFSQLISEIVQASGQRPFPFGEGLALGCHNYQEMWEGLRQELSRVDPGKRHSNVLRGFLTATSSIDGSIAEEFLKKAVTDDVLCHIYPWLELSVEINDRGVERLKQALEYGGAPIDLYQYLGHGRFHEGMNDENFCSLLNVIKSKPAGLNVAIEIFYMRLNPNRQLVPNDPIISLGRELLDQIQFRRSDMKSDSMDYKLSLIVEACLEGETASEATRSFCKKLVTAISEGNLFPMDFTQLLGSLTQKQPLIFLDCFWGDSPIGEQQVGPKLSFDMEAGNNPLSKIEDNIILDWCNGNPYLRYQRVASIIQPYRTGTVQSQLEWTPLALTLIENAPDPIPVLNELKDSLKPMSYSGSLAQIMEKQLDLLINLKAHPIAAVSEWAVREEINFQEEIIKERQREHVHNQLRDERFE